VSAEHATLHVWVSGRVQGVFFRDTTRRRALELGLSGWVRNLPDGRVEALFCGPRAACEAALAFVRSGPPPARVDGVEIEWGGPPEIARAGFEVRY